MEARQTKRIRRNLFCDIIYAINVMLYKCIVKIFRSVSLISLKHFPVGMTPTNIYGYRTLPVNLNIGL